MINAFKMNKTKCLLPWKRIFPVKDTNPTMARSEVEGRFPRISTSFTFPSIRSGTRAVQGMVLNLALISHLELPEITGWIKGSPWVWLIQKWWKENWHEIGKTAGFGRWCLGPLWLSSRMPCCSPQAGTFSTVVARESMAAKSICF